MPLENIVRNSVQAMYSQLDYYQFCKFMGFDPKHSIKYWESFQQLAKSLTSFDKQHLQKILTYAKSLDEPPKYTEPLDDGIDSLIAYRLGKVGAELQDYPRQKIGDEIDRGLVLLRLLRESGFFIVSLDE